MLINPEKISKFLLILATLSLIIRKGIFLETFIPKPFEFFLFLALIGSIFYFFPKNLDKFKIIDKKIYLALFIFLFSVGLATLISYLRYGVGFNTEGVLTTIRFLIIIIIFILFYVFLKEDEIFFKRIWLSFLVPIIFTPFLIFPELAYKFSLVKGDGRFYGFLQNPALASLFFLVALSFFFGLFFKNFYQKKKLFALLFFFSSVIMTSFIFWSQSRTTWIEMVVALITLNYLIINVFKRNKLNYVLLNFFLTFLLLVISFIILPSSAKTTSLLRIFPQYTSFVRESHPDLQTTSSEQVRQVLSKIKTEGSMPDILYDQLRPTIWKEYLKSSLKNPLGLGLNYFPVLAIKINGEPAGTHNDYLNSFAYGGPGALGAFLYILWRAFVNLRNKLKNFLSPYVVYYIGISSALAGLLTCSILSGVALINYFFWILLVMALV